jgi:hypothetical protein
MSRKEMVEILTKNGIKASLKDSTIRLEKKMEKCKILDRYAAIMESSMESSSVEKRRLEKVGKDLRRVSDGKVRKVFKRISRRIAKNGRSSVSRWMEEILSATSPFDAAVKYVQKSC